MIGRFLYTSHYEGSPYGFIKQSIEADDELALAKWMIDIECSDYAYECDRSEDNYHRLQTLLSAPSSTDEELSGALARFGVREMLNLANKKFFASGQGAFVSDPDGRIEAYVDILNK